MSLYRVAPPAPAPRRRPSLVDRLRARLARWRRRRAWTRWHGAALRLDAAFWAWHATAFQDRASFARYSAALDLEERARKVAFASDC